MIDKAKTIIKSHLYYQVFIDKSLTPNEKQNKVAKLNKMLQDSTITLECMKVAQNCLNQAIKEMENKNEKN